MNVFSSFLGHPRLIRRVLPVGVPSIIFAGCAFVFTLAPEQGLACACGCGVFAVGTSSMFPTGSGGTVYLEYDYQDQTINWHGTPACARRRQRGQEYRNELLHSGLAVYV